MRIKTIEDLLKLNQIKNKNVDKFVDETVKRKKLAVDCSEGCSSCCKSIRVELLQTEAFPIYEYLKNTLDQEELDALKEKLFNNYQKVQGTSLKAHLNHGIECPLLVNEKCSVYEVRPLMCRQYLSPSRAGCISTNCLFTPYQNEIMMPLIAENGKPAMKFRKTLEENGISSEACEINESLYKLLDEEVTFEDLKSGNALFSKLKL